MRGVPYGMRRACALAWVHSACCLCPPLRLKACEGSTMADHLREIARAVDGGAAAAGLRTRALLERPTEAFPSPFATPLAATAAARTTSSRALAAAATAASSRGRVNALDTQIQALVQQLQVCINRMRLGG